MKIDTASILTGILEEHTELLQIKKDLEDKIILYNRCLSSTDNYKKEIFLLLDKDYSEAVKNGLLDLLSSVLKYEEEVITLLDEDLNDYSVLKYI